MVKCSTLNLSSVKPCLKQVRRVTNEHKLFDRIPIAREEKYLAAMVPCQSSFIGAKGCISVVYELEEKVKKHKLPPPTELNTP